MIQYGLECIAFQLVFLLVYDLFLKRETFFQWNRVYLIGTYSIALILPWIKLEALRTSLPQEYALYPNFMLVMDEATLVQGAEESTLFSFSWQEGLFITGMLISLLLFGFKLFQILRLKRKGSIQYFADFTQVIIANSTIAFSFFKSIFLGDQLLQKDHEHIIQHELVHIQQGHSWDLLFFELMRIIGWFSPLVYIYQSRVSELHEFIADAQVSKTNKKEQYQLLLSQVFQSEHISFINPFFKTSLIKKRIVMLQKAKSKSIWKLKYLLLLPIVASMLFYSSCEQEAEQQSSKVRIAVQDVENLSEVEEVQLYQKLIALSENKSAWELLIDDGYSSILFLPSDGNSFISGPNGEHIPAKMTVQSSLKGFTYTMGNTSVPFAMVDKVPVFPGCEDAEDKRACFNEKMQLHISKNFNYPQEAKDKGIQGRVNTVFLIAVDGSIRDIKLKGPDKILEDEVARIIERLPEMIPGEANGQKVGVPYSIPITFRLHKSLENSSNLNTTGKDKGMMSVKGYTKNIDRKMYMYGKITDGQRGLPGANIIIRSANRSEVSNFDGDFIIEIVKGDVITFQYKGLPITELTIANQEEYQVNNFL